ncbi:tetratricopeptide repeat protein [Leptolyngbya sp. GB1-A1]|uniref:tetratricopeptide repeat protein n=1 Tax=Leptolyngbya sp. GB1-A1 TaxID=2933908 RepID=UPI00329950DC
MLDQVAAAFARQDYETAARLVKQLQQQSPNHPWVKLYVARLQEVSGQFASAEQIYRTLLRDTTHPKIALQARQGLHRLEAEAHQTPSHPTIAEAKADLANPVNGALVLEAISPEARQTAAQNFARIMRLDTYAARLLLPGRGWRLYRLGAIDQLEEWGQQLVAAEIPVFWLPLAAIQRIRVFRVESLQSTSQQATVICQSETNQKGALRFNWSEVAGRAEGRLPIFEQVVDKNIHNQLVRKEQTQDYAQVLDLHLPHRNSILRFGDWSYQFEQGQEAVPSDAVRSTPLTSNRLKWNQLVRSIEAALGNVPVWSDFPAFGESAIEPLAMVRLPSHIDLFRQTPTAWDTAFQLYSGLVFEQKSKRSA